VLAQITIYRMDAQAEATADPGRQWQTQPELRRNAEQCRCPVGANQPGTHGEEFATD
jgi:hypothetical protein